MITYNLKEKDDLYFESVGVVTDSVLEASKPEIANYINSYRKFVNVNNLEELRSYEEYLFDMLSFGVYWQVYSKIAEQTFELPVYIAQKLYRLRQKNKKYKKYIDPIRGFIATAFLYEESVFESSEFNKMNIPKFINWLDATGEFREEVKRFHSLSAFLFGLTDASRVIWFNELQKVIECFRHESGILLAQYTKNVNEFLSQKLAEHRWKEDYIFCGRKEIEYHLSMVGAELMNRAYSSAFNNSDSVTLLVPACMRLHNDEKCKADKSSFDIKCVNCSKDCNISKLNKKGIAEGFNVSIIPHSSDFTKWLKTWAVGGNKGVIGVACPLNLILGGLELKSLDIPAKCIPLDFCGCQNHWDKKGIPTELNYNELDKFISERKNNRAYNLKEESYSALCEF